MKPIVALDLETTGLDPNLDTVIEIGAVRFHGARVEAEWSSLVNPGRPLPPYISQLTGITDAMLASAPRLSRVLPELIEFVADLPLLGHNIGFDLRFLERHTPFRQNQAMDTYDLASVILPTAGRYRLSSLAQVLGVVPRIAHRGLEDARTTHQIFVRLLDRAAELPADVLSEIVELGSNLDWGAGPAFEMAAERAGVIPGSHFPEKSAKGKGESAPSRPLEPSETPQPVNPDDAAAILEPGGELARLQPGYEHRPQQTRMARAVAEALSSGKHLLVEAGTGTGKSMAYLVPAFLWAARNGRRVVVSTNTINLQDQLIRKDIPALQQILGDELKASVLKGRANYLCPARLDALRRMQPRAPEEMRVLAKVLVWLSKGGTGERIDLSLSGPAELTAWGRISAEHEECTLDACAERTGGACAFYLARTRAEASHVLVVNHALLMADIQSGNRVLPGFQHLIIDEGHHLEAATTSGMTARINEGDLPRTLRELVGAPNALLPEAAAIARRVLPQAAARLLAKAAERLEESCKESLLGWNGVFANLAEFLVGTHPEEAASQYSLQVRLVPALRSLPAWSPVEVAWDETRPHLAEITAGVTEMGDALAGYGDGASPNSDLASALRATARTLHQIYDLVDHFIFEPDPATIYWAEMGSDRRRLSLRAAPLAIGPLVEKHLWNEKDAVILTSATLTAAGEFNYLKKRLHADSADELALGSPFDYETSTLLYLANDIPEPNDRQAYQQSVERCLIALARATRGRTLVLFTSNDQLRRTGRALTDPLAREGITLYEQDEGVSRHALLESFRSDEQAVLLGTRSFWEGVDVPGEALSVLVMVRLPFDVPTDPIISARSETYESPFDEYSLPEAILRFRQGFGRLIRTRSDRGAVVVLDRRILTKRYGALFLKSLPTCTTRQGPMREAPRDVARWLGG
ncbi:MAG TPA: helicase C-terminal domain-containing protein [Anaerolineales bacterium]|nr:helicase C-terminal domain-containing protein [Anaerolineales bacterium]